MYDVDQDLRTRTSVMCSLIQPCSRVRQEGIGSTEQQDREPSRVCDQYTRSRRRPSCAIHLFGIRYLMLREALYPCQL